jgi:hypothetical protein
LVWAIPPVATAELTGFVNALAPRSRQTQEIARLATPKRRHVLRASPQSCTTENWLLGRPLDGNEGHDWSIVNYVDQAPDKAQARDYMGQEGDKALTYHGHAGVDFALANFRIMDRGVPIIAVSAGVVEEVQEGQFDRNTELIDGAPANYVLVRAPNGFSVLYLHLRKGSLRAHVGQTIVEGQVLGEVGSSGYSDVPHVHLEIRDCANNVRDPFAEKLFRAPPAYDPPAALMDVFLRAGPAFTSVADTVAVTGAPLRVTPKGATVYAAAYFAQLHEGDDLQIEFVQPNGAHGFDMHQKISGSRYWGSYKWWTSFYLDDPGRWSLRFYVNGQRLSTKPLDVLP